MNRSPLFRIRFDLAALAFAAVTTLATLSGLVLLADGYRGDAQLAQAAAAQPVQQVVVIGQRPSRS